MSAVDAPADIGEILSGFDSGRQNLIPILQELQELSGYLAEEALGRVADHLDLSVNDVFGVATFYTQFRFTPLGKHQVKVCRGTACHVRNSALILKEVSRRLGIVAGETTEDLKYSLDEVACFGSCALAPVVVINGKVHGRMTVRKMTKLLDEMNEL